MVSRRLPLDGVDDELCGVFVEEVGRRLTEMQHPTRHLAAERLEAPEKLPTERLLAQLPAVESTVTGKQSQLQWVVDQLRSREVSWAQIGDALGVSRQAAWERFS